MSNRRSKKKFRDESPSPTPSPEPDDIRVLFYIPASGINLEVLLFYIKIYLGDDSDAEPGHKPKSKDREIGYFIRSKYGLSSEMVADLKRDTKQWKNEQQETRTREYSRSETAKRRLQLGASGQKTVPAKTAQREAAERAVSAQPQLGRANTQPINTPMSYDRHQAQQDSAMQPGSFNSAFYQSDTNQRHQNQYPAQPGFNYASPAPTQSRSPPAINLNLNYANYTQNVPQRHQSAPQPNVLPSIEGQGRFETPAPPYREEDGDGKPVQPGQPGQPSTGGSQGWQSKNYPAAGSRHNR